jgi:tryptophan synthase beta chain
MIRAVAYHQNEVFEAAQLFARNEGIVIAPETAHAVKAVIDEALNCRKSGEEKVILFNNSGHGHFDLSSYEAHIQGKLEDYEYPADLIRESLAHLPKRL